MSEHERRILRERSFLPPALNVLGVFLLCLSALLLLGAFRGDCWQRVAASIAAGGAGALLLAAGRVILVLEDIRAVTFFSSKADEAPRAPSRRRPH